MDYEKKYKEGVEWLRDWIYLATTGEMREQMEKHFPELKESEGEQSKKWILEYLYEGLRKSDEQFKSQFKAAIAWFEKHNLIMAKSPQLGEQKPTDKVEPKFKVGDKIQYLKGCGTIMTIEKIENGEYIFANNLGHTTIEDGNKWYLVERNPTWSEEDENAMWLLKDIVRHSNEINEKIYTMPLKEKLYDWLKSLKDRVQPKQEWSEKDEGFWDLLLAIFTNEHPNGVFTTNNIPIFDGNWVTSTKIIAWLKSIKERYSWKPSDEQIYWLKWAIGRMPDTEKANEAEAVLEELLEQLKKLREDKL